MARIKLFRWRAIVPLLLLLGLLGLGWLLLLDRIAERGIESAATHVVGARVDLAGAEVRLGEGALVLRGLAVTNPDAPMTNLFEADEIVADMRVLRLLEQKLAIDTVAVRGLRFGTRRETSGALENPSPESRRVRSEVAAWADALRVPEFSLEGLGQAVDVGAVRPESLQTARRAEALTRRGDELRESWERSLSGLDLQPAIDSARALLERLQEADPGRLGAVGAVRLGNSTRSTIERLGDLIERVQSVDSTARFDLGAMQEGLSGLAAAREADYAYARGLLRLPSLDAPDISPGVFGAAAVSWIKPVLYWLRLAEEYLPPGLDPRRRAGPQRPRRAGTTVEFPQQGGKPRFLLEHGDASLELAGEGLAAGSYAAVISGLSSAPSLYGKPLRLAIGRTDAAAGPGEVRVGALLDHVTPPVRDSVDVSARGIGLPELELPSLGAEDFAFYQELIPGAIVRLGVGLPEPRTRWPLHSSHFDLNEDALPVGARFFTRAALALAAGYDRRGP